MTGAAIVATADELRDGALAELQAVGFVSELCGPEAVEFTTALMPIAGWGRWLLDDIYLRRTFHRDAANIQKKLAGYAAVPADRMLFFAPEGAIADIGNARDAAYIDA